MQDEYSYKQARLLTGGSLPFGGRKHSMCDPDDLTVNIDLLEIYNEKADNRAEHMRSLLSGCPQDASELIAKTVAKMVELDAETKSDV